VSLGQLYYYGARGLREDVGEAFKWYTKAAEQGDATAMGYLGNMYAQGVHVKADNATAVNWYRLVAINSCMMTIYDCGGSMQYSPHVISLICCACDFVDLLRM
jgi:TPR repeat protein